MKSAVYPGSFDPITLGHVNIIERISPLYNQIHVLVANAVNKSYLFSPEERMEMAKQALKKLPNIKVEVFEGLTVDFARKVDAHVIIRGLRAVNDFESEMAMASMNKQLHPKIETLLVFSSPEYAFLSSRLVKEVNQYGGSLEGLVPPVVSEFLKRK